MKIEAAYLSLKEEQEAHEKRMSQRPSHLQMVQGPGFYPAWSGNSLHIRFTKQICPCLMKFVSVVKHNPIALGEDPQTWTAKLRQLYKAKYESEFRFFHCYKFAKDKPKFLSMFAVENNDTTNKPVPSNNNNSNKHGAGVGSKEKWPIGTKHAKKIKQEDEMAEHMAKKFGITTPTVSGGSLVVSSVAVNGKSNGSGLHNALSKFLSVAGETMNMWLLQSQMVANASEDVCQWFANSLLKKEIAKLKNQREVMKKQQQSKASYSDTNSPPSDIEVA